MYIARKMRKENIAEYILYMFQVEDLIRAFNLDMQLISDHLIKRYDLGDQQLEEVSAWYSNLAAMMEKEGVRHSGHLQFLVNHINDLNEFHLRILNDDLIADYSALYKTNIGLINEFRLKGNASANDVETCINAVYGYLLLKIQKKEITEQTTDAIKRFATLLGRLSGLYKDFESGDLEL